MSTRHTLTYCGMRGIGRTVKEAKEDAARKIAAILQADFSPVILSWRGRIKLFWRDPDGIHSAMMDHKEGEIQFSGTCAESESMEGAVERGRMHLAQNGWKSGERYIPDILTSEKSKHDFVSWRGFQWAFIFIREQHQEIANQHDNRFHAWSCHNGRAFSDGPRPSQELNTTL